MYYFILRGIEILFVWLIYAQQIILVKMEKGKLHFPHWSLEEWHFIPNFKGMFDWRWNRKDEK